jgi:predicted metal-dependent HD superfamily phosphohydrolase
VDTHRIWTTAWSELGAKPSSVLYTELAGRYSETERVYHTLQHIEECFEKFESARQLAEHPEEIELALWFHDAVYDTKSGDSEQRSAELAAGCLRAASAPAESSCRICDLILATQHVDMPGSTDAKLLVDVDLSILAAPTQRFWEYESQIRQEYAWVPDGLYRRERSRILRALLDRPRVYSTEHFFRLQEIRARANLKESLDRLLD